MLTKYKKYYTIVLYLRKGDKMINWKNIRAETGLTQKQIGAKFGKTRQEMQRYESGKIKMPIKIQIEYLKLRNEKNDKIIIKYLEGLMKNDEFK